MSRPNTARRDHRFQKTSRPTGAVFDKGTAVSRSATNSLWSTARRRNRSSGCSSRRGADTCSGARHVCTSTPRGQGQLHENRISDGLGNRPFSWRQSRSMTPLENRPPPLQPGSSWHPAQSRTGTATGFRLHRLDDHAETPVAVPVPGLRGVGSHSLVELLQGRFSKGVMERLCRQDNGLFPRPSEIRFSCELP